MSEEVERRQSTARTSLPAVPTPRELSAFLPYALEVLQAPFGVRVDCFAQDEYVSAGKAAKKPHGSRATLATNMMPMASQSSPVDSSSPLPDDESTSELVISAVHDSQGHLVELALCEVQVPCLLLKLVILCAPFQALLSRLTLHFCRLDALALNQLIHVVTGTQVSELSLDDSPLSCGGFHLLLEKESHLRWLSLDRCSLGDDGAIKLAATLRHPLPGSVSLKALSLACNGIGDAGACAFAEALRSNRQLQYLNLADNHVTDAGAIPLLRCLCEFSLSYDEVIGTRRRFMARLRSKQELYMRIYAELVGNSARRQSEPAATVARGRKPRKTSALSLAPPTSMSLSEAIAAKAEAMVEEQLGPLSEPFGTADTTQHDGVVYCGGNWILSWLNLAYNSLGYASLVELARVMADQSSASGVVQGVASSAPQSALSGAALGQSRASGLVRVVVEGNALPLACVELAAVTARIEAVLDRAAARPAVSKKQTTSSRRK